MFFYIFVLISWTLVYLYQELFDKEVVEILKTYEQKEIFKYLFIFLYLYFIKLWYSIK